MKLIASQSLSNDDGGLKWCFPFWWIAFILKHVLKLWNLKRLPLNQVGVPYPPRTAIIQPLHIVPFVRRNKGSHSLYTNENVCKRNYNLVFPAMATQPSFCHKYHSSRYAENQRPELLHHPIQPNQTTLPHSLCQMPGIQHIN